MPDRELRLAPQDEARWWGERGERELRQILFWRWDPIGVQDDLPYSEGEYDSYVPRVVGVLQRGGSARDIAALLAGIERSEMESETGPHEAAAQLIVQWYDNSRRYWREFEADR